MTVEEKRAALERYCADHDDCNDIVDCPLYHSNCFFDTLTDEEVNESYNIVFPEVVVSKIDAVNHPSHYADGKIEPIDYIEDKKLGFCLGNAIKYISRAGKKDKTKEIEDLKKAVWYIERRIQEVENGD